MKIWSVLNNTLQEWKKDKKIFSSLLDNPKLHVPHLHSFKPWERKIMKSSIWLTQSINTFSNNWKILKVTNLEMLQNKDFNSINHKTKRRNYNNKKHHSKVSVNYANKFLEIKLKKFKYLKDLMNHHVHW